MAPDSRAESRGPPVFLSPACPKLLIMKLHQDVHLSLNTISAYEDDHVVIHRTRHSGNLIVTADAVLPGWASTASADPASLNKADIEYLLSLQPQLVIFGTGKRQRFGSPALLRPLIEARIGYEFMDLAAACRTYNILVAEGRAVALALLHESSEPLGNEQAQQTPRNFP